MSFAKRITNIFSADFLDRCDFTLASERRPPFLLAELAAVEFPPLGRMVGIRFSSPRPAADPRPPGIRSIPQRRASTLPPPAARPSAGSATSRPPQGRYGARKETLQERTPQPIFPCFPQTFFKILTNKIFFAPKKCSCLPNLFFRKLRDQTNFVWVNFDAQYNTLQVQTTA